MQGKRGTIVALALLVVVLVCGSLGYRMLSARLKPELAPAPAETATPVDEPDYPLLADHDPTVYTAGGEAVTTL